MCNNTFCHFVNFYKFTLTNILHNSMNNFERTLEDVALSFGLKYAGCRPWKVVRPSPSPKRGVLSPWSCGTIMSINVCVCVCVCVCICEGLCVFVDKWPKKGSYLMHFWPASKCLEGPLCLFWREDHTRDLKKRTKDVRQLEVRLRSRERFKPKMQSWSVGSKTWVQNSRRAAWIQERRHRTVKTMVRGVSTFGSCVGF